jgi:hypothetical protein
MTGVPHRSAGIATCGCCGLDCATDRIDDLGRCSACRTRHVHHHPTPRIPAALKTRGGA